jgi:hypothetical protein
MTSTIVKSRRFFVLPIALAWFSVTSTLCCQQPIVFAANPPAIVAKPDRSDYTALELEVRALEKQNCKDRNTDRYFQHPTMVSELVGGKVKDIRVVRFLPGFGIAAKIDPAQAVERVWQGTFQSVSCQITWDEWAVWSIKAIVEFEDGTKSTLITSGVHVAVQDHDGKTWFLRLLPAAQ